MQKRKKAQIDIVRERLEKNGVIDNLWAIEHYILRLGALIYVLRKHEKMRIRTEYLRTEGHRNCHYYLTKKI